jgi:hypothetical protein
MSASVLHPQWMLQLYPIFPLKWYEGEHYPHFFFASILPVDCLVELIWKRLKRYSTAPFIKFFIFHLCTARAINACITSLSAGSFHMKKVILCISDINLLLLKKNYSHKQL